jgi:hypothetical protein
MSPPGPFIIVSQSKQWSTGTLKWPNLTVPNVLWTQQPIGKPPPPPPKALSLVVGTITFHWRVQVQGKYVVNRVRNSGNRSFHKEKTDITSWWIAVWLTALVFGQWLDSYVWPIERPDQMIWLGAQCVGWT